MLSDRLEDLLNIMASEGTSLYVVVEAELLHQLDCFFRGYLTLVFQVRKIAN